MDDVRVNYIRLMKIADGEIEPQTKAEEFFLKFYLSAASGQLLALPLDEHMDALVVLDLEEVWHCLIAYAKGQKDLEENDQELFAAVNDKKTVH